MRTTSSFKLVGELLPPMNVGLPFKSTALDAGKIPALSRAVELGEIMQAGIVLLGKGDPCTIPAGSTPPGQCWARTDADTFDALGTLITALPKLPPYVDASGTG